MEREEKFFEQQFVALRTEIENAKERAFKIYSIGGLAIPVLSGLSQTNNFFKDNNAAYIVTIFLPFLVLGGCLLHLVSCHRYIDG